MTYAEMYREITKAPDKGTIDILFARRTTWRADVIVYHGWIYGEDTTEYPGLCVKNDDGTDHYIPTEGDFKADDWTFDVWNEGEEKMDLSYFEIKKLLKTTPNCYALRDGWDEEHAMLAYNLLIDRFFLTDFGVDEGRWKPTEEDINTKDWSLVRYIL